MSGGRTRYPCPVSFPLVFPCSWRQRILRPLTARYLGCLESAYLCDPSRAEEVGVAELLSPKQPSPPFESFVLVHAVGKMCGNDKKFEAVGHSRVSPRGELIRTP